jgi:hypothetical protein
VAGCAAIGGRAVGPAVYAARPAHQVGSGPTWWTVVLAHESVRISVLAGAKVLIAARKKVKHSGVLRLQR